MEHLGQETVLIHDAGAAEGNFICCATALAPRAHVFNCSLATFSPWQGDVHGDFSAG